MRYFRFFISGDFKVGDKVVLSSRDTHYVKDVLRFRMGEELIIFNGKGKEYKGIVVELNKQQIIVELKSFCFKNRESPLKIHLGQVISKKEHMEYTLQKATELGVTSFTPLFSEFSEIKLSGERLENRLQRWRNIVISASEQSGRNYLMEIKPPQKLEDFIYNIPGTLFFLEPSLQVISLSKLPKQTEVSLIVGAEGGFSTTEIEYLKKSRAIGVNLGPRILRTETAGMAAVILFQNFWGDLGSNFNEFS